jgi:hypothetical protein
MEWLTFKAISLCLFEERLFLAVVGNVPRKFHDSAKRVELVLSMLRCERLGCIFERGIATLPTDTPFVEDSRIFAKLLFLARIRWKAQLSGAGARTWTW